MRGSTDRRNEKTWANTYTPNVKAPSLLLLEKVARRPDVEGTPYGIAVLKQTLQLEFRGIVAFSNRAGTCYRGPLHIPPLRRGPSPAGEGFFGFRLWIIRIRPGFLRIGSAYRCFYGAIATGNRLFGIRCAEHHSSSTAARSPFPDGEGFKKLPRRGSWLALWARLMRGGTD